MKDFINLPEYERFSGLYIHKITTNDFENLLRELEVAAFGARMRQLGYNLCEALDMQEEYYKVHKIRIEGMRGKNIDDYKSRKFLEQSENMFFFGAFNV